MTKKAAKKQRLKKKAAKKAASKAKSPKSDLDAVKKLGAANDNLKAELKKTIVGMDNVIDETLIAISSRGMPFWREFLVWRKHYWLAQ